MERSILDFAAVLELPLEITHQHTCFFFNIHPPLLWTFFTMVVIILNWHYSEDRWVESIKFIGVCNPSRGVSMKRCFGNMQQIYKREITLRHGSSPVNLLPSFRTLFLKNTPKRLLL